MGSESSLLFSPPVSYLRRGDGMNGVFCALMLAGLLYAAATGGRTPRSARCFPAAGRPSGC